MVFCCVPYCKSKKNDSNITFHEFPVDDELHSKWIKLIFGKSLTPLDGSRVCSAHFKVEDFKEWLKVRTLKPGVSPSIFPGQSLYKIPTVKSPKRELVKKNNQAKLNVISGQRSSKKTHPLEQSWKIVSIENHLVKNTCVNTRSVEVQTSDELLLKLSKLQQNNRLLQNNIKRLKRKVVSTEKQYNEVLLKLKGYENSKCHQSVKRMLNDNTVENSSALILDEIQNYRKRKAHWSSYSIKLCSIWFSLSPKGYSFAKRNIFKLPSKLVLNQLSDVKEFSKLCDSGIMGKAALLAEPSTSVDSTFVNGMSSVLLHANDEINYDVKNIATSLLPHASAADCLRKTVNPVLTHTQLSIAQDCQHLELQQANETQVTVASNHHHMMCDENECESDKQVTPVPSHVLPEIEHETEQQVTPASCICDETECENDKQVTPASYMCDETECKSDKQVTPEPFYMLPEIERETDKQVTPASCMCDETECENDKQVTPASYDMCDETECENDKQVTPASYMFDETEYKSDKQVTPASYMCDETECEDDKQVTPASYMFDETECKSDKQVASASCDMCDNSTCNDINELQGKQNSALKQTDHASEEKVTSTLVHTQNEAEISLKSPEVSEEGIDLIVTGEPNFLQTSSEVDASDEVREAPSPHLCPLFCCHTQLTSMYMVHLKQDRLLITCLTRDVS